MKRSLLVFVSIALAMSCTSGGPEPDPATTAPAQSVAAVPSAVPDTEIGLATGTAFEQPIQAPIAFNTVDPGESELQPRPNADFPPVISHSVEDLDPITGVENPCLDCHGSEAAMYSDAPAVPPSHQVDLRRSPDSQGDEVVGARWICTSCHVTQTDTEPLVGNSSSG